MKAQAGRRSRHAASSESCLRKLDSPPRSEWKNDPSLGPMIDDLGVVHGRIVVPPPNGTYPGCIRGKRSGTSARQVAT